MKVALAARIGSRSVRPAVRAITPPAAAASRVSPLIAMFDGDLGLRGRSTWERNAIATHSGRATGIAEVVDTVAR